MISEDQIAVIRILAVREALRVLADRSYIPSALKERILAEAEELALDLARFCKY